MMETVQDSKVASVNHVPGVGQDVLAAATNGGLFGATQ